MLNKKSLAIGVKFVPQSHTDQITNMEGAMHSFVTPVVVRCEMIGDYVFSYGHGVAVFGDCDVRTRDGKRWARVRLVRDVVLSAAIQLDFENAKVMTQVARLGESEMVGRDLLKDPEWEILSVERKQDQARREHYDKQLKAHMVYHLTRDHSLPARSHVKESDVLTSASAITLLEKVISSPYDAGELLIGKFVTIRSKVLSLELLYNAAGQQVCNELSALEALCPQGYVYTYDPAQIFARKLGAKILNRLMLCGVKSLSEHSIFTNMKIFAFNDYAEPGIMPFVHDALRVQDVKVLRKEDLFQGKGDRGLYDVKKLGGCERAMLVVHNNSDGFGQNIESESSGGSLDGAIGASSSAAASLARERKDLLDFLC